MRRVGGDRRGRGLIALMALAAVSAAGTTAQGADLFKPGNWTAMAADRPAERVGDSLTVLIYETSQASNSVQHQAQRSGSLSGQITAGTMNKSGQIGLSGSYAGSGQTERSGQMVAQITVVVDGILPNGDLHVSGEQAINLNGERTRIHLKGRVRRADITNTNTVLSSLLADAAIEYGGAGFGPSKAKPGLITRVLSWFGAP